MFERFTEKACRVIFFARYEASQDGDPYIRCVHLLVAMEREAHEILRAAGLAAEQVSKTHRAMEDALGIRRERYSTAVEVPLDLAAKNALKTALEAAKKFKAHWVTPAHILWGIYHSDAQLRTELEMAGLSTAKLEAVTQEHTEMEVHAPGQIVERRFAPWSTSRRATPAGIGYDLHRLAEGRKLIVGGVELPFDKGPVGHSDGDVLAHAVCDALLGAAGLGDIGTHFPDTDSKWKGGSSLLFLEHIRKLLEERGLRITHIDAVVVTEKPKLGPHFPAMREALAKALGIEPAQINLKAKTNEGVDAIGRGEAIAAYAIATLEG